MMTNKMLLSSVQEEGIPYKPFPEGEQRIYMMNANDIEIYFPDTPFFDDTYQISKFSGIQLPKNHCTIAFGVTDETFADYVTKHNGNQQQEEINIKIDFYIKIGYDIEFEEDINETILHFTKTIDITNWSASYEEIRIQLDFTTKKYVFYPTVDMGPFLAKYTLSNGNEVISYPNAYIRMSNEIHELGPQRILTIDNRA